MMELARDDSDYKTIMECLSWSYIGEAEEPSVDEIINYLDTMGIIYLIFSIAHTILVLAILVYMIYRVLRKDPLSCFQWLLLSMLLLGSILATVNEF